MRPKTRLPIPDPGKSEFKNFDRLMRIIVPAERKPKKKWRKKRKTS